MHADTKHTNTYTHTHTHRVSEAAVTAVMPLATGWCTLSLFWISAARPIRKRPRWNTPMALSHWVVALQEWGASQAPNFHTSTARQIDWWLGRSKATSVLRFAEPRSLQQVMCFRSKASLNRRRADLESAWLFMSAVESARTLTGEKRSEVYSRWDD